MTLLTLATIMLVTAASTQSAGASSVGFPGHCGGPQYKPRTILIACGTGQTLVRSIHWRQWGGGRARGSGKFLIDDCQPDCASGTFHSYPSEVTLSRRRFCRSTGRWQYRHLSVQVSVADAADPLPPRDIQQSVPCKGPVRG